MSPRPSRLSPQQGYWGASSSGRRCVSGGVFSRAKAASGPCSSRDPRIGGGGATVRAAACVCAAGRATRRVSTPGTRAGVIAGRARPGRRGASGGAFVCATLKGRVKAD